MSWWPQPTVVQARRPSGRALRAGLAAELAEVGGGHALLTGRRSGHCLGPDELWEKGLPQGPPWETLLPCVQGDRMVAHEQPAPPPGPGAEGHLTSPLPTAAPCPKNDSSFLRAQEEGEGREQGWRWTVCAFSAARGPSGAQLPGRVGCGQRERPVATASALHPAHHGQGPELQAG